MQFDDQKSTPHCASSSWQTKLKPARRLFVPPLARSTDFAPAGFNRNFKACGRAEIGAALTGFGALFTMMGVLMFFNNGLMAIGNVRAFAPLQPRSHGSSDVHSGPCST